MDLASLHKVKRLVQVSPPNTNTFVVISKPIKRKLILTSVDIVNYTGSTAKFSLFVTKNSTTYDGTTAISFNESLAANTHTQKAWENGLSMDPDQAGKFAVNCDTANAVTITVHGIEA